MLEPVIMGCSGSVPIQHDNQMSGGGCCSAAPKAEFTYRKDTCALEYWEPLRLVGEGSISSIHLVRRRPERVDVPYKEKADIMRLAEDGTNPVADDEELYALKSIMKDHVRNNIFLEEMRSEIYTMSRLCHKIIVNVKEAFERKRHIYLIMEHCKGGDLEGRKYSEAEAATIVRKILEAVAYMHKQKVVHRDLKLENVMFDKDPKEDPTAEIKIIDFGLATKFLSNEYKNMTARVGTLYSMAPQVLQGVYDSKCDIWSIGVIAFILLSGNKPFWGPPQEMSWEKRKKIIIDRIMRCEYMKMKGPSWTNISPEAKKFIEKMLQLDPFFRPSAEKALKHPWIVKFQDCKPSRLPAQDQQYAKKVQIKRQLQVLIAQELVEDEIVQLKTALVKHDPNKEDQIPLENFREALLKAQLSSNRVNTVFAGANPKGTMSYIDILNDALDRKEREQEALIQDVFQQCGTGDSSCCQMSKDKLREILRNREGVTDATLGSILGAIAEAGGEQSISCQQLVDRLKALEMHRVQIICSCREEGKMEEPVDDDDDTRDLVDETNAVIPGGKLDSTANPLWVYDESSKSVRKCRPGEDISSIRV